MSTTNCNKRSTLNIRVEKNEYFAANTGMTTPLSTAKIVYRNIKVLGSYMLWIFGLIIIFGLGACSGEQDNNQDNSEKPKVEKEQHSPADDLEFFSKKSRNGALEKNLIKGFVENKSTHVTYSNIVVMVEFYDKENAIIKDQQLKLNESIPPQEMQKLNLEVDFPESIKGYRIKLVSADGQSQK